MRYGWSGWAALLALLALSPLARAGAQAPASWVRAHSTLERTLARLSEATSSGERAVLADRIARLGPPERAASGIAAALAVELEPGARRALLTAAIRLAALDALAARALAPIAIQRFGEASSPEDRAAWARLLGLLATDDAIDALMSRATEDAPADALVQAHATGALIAALGTDADQLRVMALLGRIGDRQAVEPLFAQLRTDGDVSTLEALSRIAVASDDSTLAIRVRAALVAALPGSEDAHRLVGLFGALERLGSLGLDHGSPDLLAVDLPAVERTVDLSERPSVLLAHLTDPEPVVAAAALRCAHAIDPRWAADFAATLSPSDGRVAFLLGASDEPRLVPLAVELAGHARTRDLALDFLTRARDGAGLDALTALNAPPLVIAVASRRWGRGGVHFDDAAHAALAGAPAGYDAMDAEPSVRRSAAIALALARELPRGPLAAWVEREPEPEVRAWLLEAARRHHTPLDAHWLRQSLHHDPEPALILVVPWAEGSSSDRRALRRALSTLLGLGSPAQVAAAVWSLAAMGARDASAAIEALLEDAHPTVRIAAGRALFTLRPDRAHYVRARGAIDPDPRASRLLSTAPVAHASFDVLFLDVTVAATTSGAVWLEVQTDDGLLRQLPASLDGTFALLDVPGSVAEVRLLLRD